MIAKKSSFNLIKQNLQTQSVTVVIRNVNRCQMLIFTAKLQDDRLKFLCRQIFSATVAWRFWQSAQRPDQSLAFHQIFSFQIPMASLMILLTAKMISYDHHQEFTFVFFMLLELRYVTTPLLFIVRWYTTRIKKKDAPLYLLTKQIQKALQTFVSWSDFKDFQKIFHSRPISGL